MNKTIFELDLIEGEGYRWASSYFYLFHFQIKKEFKGIITSSSHFMAEDNRLNDQTIYKVSVFPFNIIYSSHSKGPGSSVS